VKSVNLESHMKTVHGTKLKAKLQSEEHGKKSEAKSPKAPIVGFPWRWVGVSALVLIIVLAVIVIKPGSPSGTNPNVPEECIEGKTLARSFTWRLHIHYTNLQVIPAVHNYTHPIPHDIGKEPINDQQCTRRMYSGSSSEYNSSRDPAIIHVNSPEPKTYYLMDWFKIWGQDLNSTPEHKFVVSYGEPTWTITLTVDFGNPPTNKWENIELTQDRLIDFYIYQ